MRDKYSTYRYFGRWKMKIYLPPPSTIFFYRKRRRDRTFEGTKVLVYRYLSQSLLYPFLRFIGTFL